MGFNPLIYKHLEQWVKTHWTINAEIVKEPLIKKEPVQKADYQGIIN